MKIACASVSTTDQCSNPQTDSLSKAGCKKLITLVADGVQPQGPESKVWIMNIHFSARELLFD
jgi:hypothetical protein